MILLVTGASRGLGYSLCRESVLQGHTVLAAYRNHPSESLAQLAQQYPLQVELLEMDVADSTQVEQAAKEAASRHPSLDCLINNAAIQIGRYDTIEKLDLDDIQACMEVNAYGAIRVMQAFLPLIRHKGGCIANISSEMGGVIHTYADDFGYCISKAALNMASEKVRKYLQPEGVRVFALHPGWIHTDMGGAEAPTDPAEVARCVLKLAFGEKEPDVSPAFIDRFGNPMPL